MNKLIKTLCIILACSVVVSCYPDYVADYEYDGIYFAQQYDLRTFVVGEGMKFEIGTVLAGVMKNDRERNVRIMIDDDLVTGDLSEFTGSDAPYTAYDVMSGACTEGRVSAPYVTAAIKEAGYGKLIPLPSKYYEFGNENKIIIRKGNHTGTTTVKADSATLCKNTAAKDAVYAIGVRIINADADTVLQSASFEVVAVRIQNMLFGNWYYGGKTSVQTSAGEVISEKYTPMTIPQEETRLYVLTSTGAYTLKTNKFGVSDGSLELTLKDDYSIDVKDMSGVFNLLPDGDGSYYNGARLLQDRKIFLNYKYLNSDGTYTVINDTLQFRNRIRDGVNEWRDEVEEHYRN